VLSRCARVETKWRTLINAVSGRDVTGAFGLVVGTVYTTARDVANVATFGQFSELGNRTSPDIPRSATGIIGSIERAIGDALIPEYGAFGGLHWGMETVGYRPDLALNQGDYAALIHDYTGEAFNWIKMNLSTTPQTQWVGPVGAAYALLGTIPFAIDGLFQKGH
jgi:hypothetical protein